MGVLEGRVALVAGATRGAGRAIAVELARAGAVVWATGRSSRGAPSEMGRPETIEETGDLMVGAGGAGRAERVDHLDPDQVARLVAAIDAEHGGLDLLVDDVWGGDVHLRWNTPLWEQPLGPGLRMLRNGVESHAITSHHALPLLIRRPGGLVVELTDGTAEYNARYRADVGFFYDLVKASIARIAFAQSVELAPHGGTALALTPGWLRSEAMLEVFGVTEATWRDATAAVPHFVISESPTYTGRAVVALAADPDVRRLGGQTVSSGALAQEYGFTDVDGTRPDAWRYIAEVQDTGLPADATGYR